MSDDLVKRLLDWPSVYARQAADRIEELEAHLANMTGLWAKSDSEKQLLLARIEELEAKLAKEEVINRLLTVVAILKDPSDVRFPEALDLAERFSTTIAELKGPSHE